MRSIKSANKLSPFRPWHPEAQPALKGADGEVEPHVEEMKRFTTLRKQVDDGPEFARRLGFCDAILFTPATPTRSCTAPREWYVVGSGA